MKILITGGSGFVGTNLINYLLKDKNNKIFSIDYKKIQMNTIYELDKITTFKINLTSKNLINILKDIKPEIIFNLAAESQVLRSSDNPSKTYKSNIFGTLNLFDSLRMLDLNPTIIHASTDKVYGISKDLPYKEDHKLSSNFTYDVSKISADFIAQNYKYVYKQNITIFRSSNIYGPADLNFDRLIPHIIKSLITNKQPIIRSDGNFLREYIYVEDLIKYLLMLSKNKSEEHIFNIGSGQVFSVNDVYKKISSLLGIEIKPKILNQKLNEIPKQRIDMKKFKTIFKPNFSETNLDDGLSNTISWYKDFYE